MRALLLLVQGDRRHEHPVCACTKAPANFQLACWNPAACRPEELSAEVSQSLRPFSHAPGEAASCYLLPAAPLLQADVGLCGAGMQLKGAPQEALLHGWQPLPEDTSVDARPTQYCQDHVIIKKGRAEPPSLWLRADDCTLDSTSGCLHGPCLGAE